MWDIFAKSFMSGKTGLENEKITTTSVIVSENSKIESVTTTPSTTSSRKASTNEAKNVSW